MRERELMSKISVVPNCSKLEEGVFIASAQNPTVGHLSSSASVEEPGRPDGPPEQPACGPVDRARRRAFSVTPRLRPAYGPVRTGPSGAPSGAPGQAPGISLLSFGGAWRVVRCGPGNPVSNPAGRPRHRTARCCIR